MEKALNAERWTLLDFEGTPIAEGLPSKASAVHAMLMDDGHDYEIRSEEGGGWHLWLTNQSRNRGGNCRLVESSFSGHADDEAKAEAEIFEEVAAMAGKWRAGGGYEIVTNAQRAEELAEAEDDEGETWFAFYPFGRPGDAAYGWGTRAEAERYQAFENRGRSPDAGEWYLMDRVDDGTDNLEGFNIGDFFAGNPEAASD